MQICEGAKAFGDALRPCCNCNTKCNPFVELFALLHAHLNYSQSCLVCIVCAFLDMDMIGF